MDTIANNLANESVLSSDGVDVENSCWFYRVIQPSVNIKRKTLLPASYGRIKVHKKFAVTSHKLTWALAHADDAAFLEKTSGHIDFRISHLCGNNSFYDPSLTTVQATVVECRNCINPAHLHKETIDVNEDRKGCRNSCPCLCPHTPKCLWNSKVDGTPVTNRCKFHDGKHKIAGYISPKPVVIIHNGKKLVSDSSTGKKDRSEKVDDGGSSDGKKKEKKEKKEEGSGNDDSSSDDSSSSSDDDEKEVKKEEKKVVEVKKQVEAKKEESDSDSSSSSDSDSDSDDEKKKDHKGKKRKAEVQKEEDKEEVEATLKANGKAMKSKFDPAKNPSQGKVSKYPAGSKEHKHKYNKNK